MAREWDGVGARGVLRTDVERARDRLADAARRYEWRAVLTMLRRSPELVNAARPGGASRFAPLHQAAHGGAPAEITTELVRLGAWRTLRTARGETPLDLARANGHAHLLPLLAPVFARTAPADALAAIEARFHTVIRGRAAQQIADAGLHLPQLCPMLEVEDVDWWFPVPGMYGGFSYRLESGGGSIRLVSESWCRVVEGSGERHEIDAAGAQLMASGFV